MRADISPHIWLPSILVYPTLEGGLFLGGAHLAPGEVQRGEGDAGGDCRNDR